jgi:hypothetical protein
MKTIFVTISLLSALALPAHAESKTHRDPASVKSGHFLCGETDIDKGIDAVQTFLENFCDPAKQYSVTVYSSGSAYNNYGVCCTRK